MRMDYKNYRAPAEPAYILPLATWLVIAIIFAAIAYTSESDYQACMSEVKSVALCGGGNN